jgi:hypothetical protein
MGTDDTGLLILSILLIFHQLFQRIFELKEALNF